MQTLAISDQQEAFVEAYLTTGDVAAASVSAAYPDRNSGDAALRRDSVQAALRAAVDRRIKTEGLALAYGAVRDILKNGNPPAVKLGAAKLVLGINGFAESAGDDGKDKPIHEMSEAELLRFMARAQRVIDAGGLGPVMAVTA